MHHFRSWLTSPALSLAGGFTTVTVIAIVFGQFSLYQGAFFRWGPPVTVFGVEITTENGFYALLGIFFLHQLVNNWVSEVVYPWIVNCIQDPKGSDLVYSPGGSLLLINLHAIYSQLDLVFIINGAVAQVSFVLAILTANLITATVVNWRYIRTKIEKRTTNEVQFFDFEE